MPKQRCQHCKKKLTPFTLFECECGKKLCIGHLNSFEHECTVDEKIKQQEKLTEQLPKVVKEKFTRI